LPKIIKKEDKIVKFDSGFFNMFRKQYRKVFDYNFVIEENISKDANGNQIKHAKKRLFKIYGFKAESDLTVQLFENPCIVLKSVDSVIGIDRDM